jgi:hypothetical protein
VGTSGRGRGNGEGKRKDVVNVLYILVLSRTMKPAEIVLSRGEGDEGE